MKIGIPKESKADEYRVSLTAASVQQLVAAGHTVFVEHNAGMGVGDDDAAYQAAGAQIVPSVTSVFEHAELIVKVKEPQPHEVLLLQPHHILFTYLHLAASRELTTSLMRTGCTAIAYETVTDEQGGLPLLAPMSRVAGRLAMINAAYLLQTHQGGRGVLLSGVRETPAADVLIIGAGQAGTSAIKMAVGMNANVTVIDRSSDRLTQLKQQFPTIQTRVSMPDVVADCLRACDVVVLAALVPGATAPRLISRAQLSTMRKGSVLIDIAIDQGGCAETSKATTHHAPTYVVDGVIHYCVANMPGAVAQTSTIALNHHTLPFVQKLAAAGVAALAQDKHLAAGLNIQSGKITHPAVEAWFKSQH